MFLMGCIRSIGRSEYMSPPERATQVNKARPVRRMRQMGDMGSLAKLCGLKCRNS
jgi:hypothetical protein